MTEYFPDEHRPRFTVIGTPVQRSDALGHVTGRTEFFEDRTFPDLAHIKIHRSVHHHAHSLPHPCLLAPRDDTLLDLHHPTLPLPLHRGGHIVVHRRGGRAFFV